MRVGKHPVPEDAEVRESQGLGETVRELLSGVHARELCCSHVRVR